MRATIGAVLAAGQPRSCCGKNQAEASGALRSVALAQAMYSADYLDGAMLHIRMYLIALSS